MHRPPFLHGPFKQGFSTEDENEVKDEAVLVDVEEDVLEVHVDDVEEVEIDEKLVVGRSWHWSPMNPSGHEQLYPRGRE